MWALAAKNGQPPPSGPVPACYFIRRTARQWGVPPWVVSGEEPTRAVVSRWYFRERFFQSADV